MAKSPEDMVQSMINNMPEKTGKSLADWLPLVANGGFQKHGQIVKWLKTDHQMTHGYANLVAHTALKSDEPVDLIAEQYAGTKAGLVPLYEQLIEVVSGYGPELEISPKKTCVSLRRSKQFAVLTPATKTRIDLGINLKGATGTARLIAQPKNSMCTHKVGVSSVTEIDDELKTWLQSAFDMA